MPGRAGWPAACAALCAVLAVPLAGALGMTAHAAQARVAQAQGPASQALARHVVLVGISGLTWSDVTPASTRELWRLAMAGSVGSLVDYAQQPVACPADGWLTLNSAAQAISVADRPRSSNVPTYSGLKSSSMGTIRSPF